MPTYYGNNRDHPFGAFPAPHPDSAPSVPAVTIEYLGETRVAVIGSITRKLYRFTTRHARVAVDARDAPTLARVPNLRRVP